MEPKALERHHDKLSQPQPVLQSISEKYRDLYDRAPIGYLLLSAKGRILESNLTAGALLGAEPSHLYHRSLLHYILPQHQPFFLLHCQRVLETQERHTCELTMVQGDGALFEAQLASLAVPEAAANRYQLRTVLMDITARAHLEKNARARLEAQLQQTQKMQAIGTLAGGIAHEFNNVSTAIIGFTQLTQLNLPAESAVQPHLHEVLRSARRAKDLVQQILTFSQQTEQESTLVPCHLVMADALRLLRASLPSTIRIEADVDKDVGTILANPTQLHQVLMNLGANAEHAMREAGGVLTVHLDVVHIDAEQTAPHADLRAGPYVQLTVRDTGHGMAPPVMDRIFEPFFTTKQVGEGTGMGLALVHGIVTHHGGAVTVDSTRGLGTTFTIYLPQVAETAFQDVPPQAPSLPPAQHRAATILFVDDEQSLVYAVELLLTHLGHELLATTDVHEALEAFRAAPQRFDLVVTDQIMPDMTGDMLAQELRRIRPDIPIILCTGYTPRIDEQKVADLGIDIVLAKPWDINDLARTIDQVLEQREST